MIDTLILFGFVFFLAYLVSSSALLGEAALHPCIFSLSLCCSALNLFFLFTFVSLRLCVEFLMLLKSSLAAAAERFSCLFRVDGRTFHDRLIEISIVGARLDDDRHRHGMTHDNRLLLRFQ